MARAPSCLAVTFTGLAEKAESKCLVAASLDLPVETRIGISAA